MPPEFIKVKFSSKSGLVTALNTAAAVPGVVDWIQWPRFFSLSHPHTLCCVTLQFLLLEARYPSQSLNIGLGQGAWFAQWDVIRYDANRSLNCAWPIGLLSLRCEEHFPRIPLIQGLPLGVTFLVWTVSDVSGLSPVTWGYKNALFIGGWWKWSKVMSIKCLAQSIRELPFREVFGNIVELWLTRLKLSLHGDRESSFVSLLPSFCWLQRCSLRLEAVAKYPRLGKKIENAAVIL